MGPEAPGPVRVLYLCGWGRSGSTVLDRTLGEAVGLTSVGELRSLWDADPTERRCGCGFTVAECPFWAPVLEATLVAPRPTSTSSVRALRDQVGRSRHLPALVRRGAAGQPGAAAYAAFLTALYRQVLAASGGDCVVDSSKHPAEAFLLADTPEVDLWVLHLVRDPRAVAYSWRRAPEGSSGVAVPPERDPLTSSAWWTAWNGVVDAALRPRLGSRYRRLRYEDLMADPEEQVGQVLTWLGRPADAVPFRSPDQVALGPAHTVAGNPNRFTTGAVTLRPDRRWEEGQAPAERALATLGALPLLHRYRYPLRPGRPTS